MTILKGKCRKCGHLFTWDEARYAAGNHVVRCKECKTLLGGGFSCTNQHVVAMMSNVPPSSCPICGAEYVAPLIEFI